MSGRYLKCFLLISLFIVTANCAGAENVNVYFLERSYVAENTLPVTNTSKQNVTINGYTVKELKSKELSGLRAKAIGDLLLRRASNSKSIKFYEIALKNLPNEADIYFNLGNIYYDERVYNIAGKYYEIAMQKYEMPENLEKTLKYKYLSLIRYGFALEKLRNFGNNHKKAEDIAILLLKSEDEIKSKYPEIMDELNKFYRTIAGDSILLIRQ